MRTLGLGNKGLAVTDLLNTVTKVESWIRILRVRFRANSPLSSERVIPADPKVEGEYFPRRYSLWIRNRMVYTAGRGVAIERALWVDDQDFHQGPHVLVHEMDVLFDIVVSHSRQDSVFQVYDRSPLDP